MPAQRVHLIIDACYAGGVVGARGEDPFAQEREARSQPLSAAGRQALIDQSLATRNPTIGYIVAASADQQAHEWSEIEGGVFSHVVLSGLWGPADINGDRRIEYSELDAFIAAAQGRVRDPRALPRVMAQPPALDHHAPLIDLSRLRAVAYLAGEAGSLGHVRLQSSSGLRLLDAHPGADMATTIAIPADQTVYLRNENDEVSVRLGPGRSTSLAALWAGRVSTSAAPRGRIETAYRQGLFAAAYSRAFYDGYVQHAATVPVSFNDDRPPERDGAPERHGSGPVDRPPGPDKLVRPPRAIGPGTDPLRRAYRRRRAGAITAFATSGALVVASGVSVAVAVVARRRFDATEFHTDAQRWAGQYRQATAAAITTGALAAAGAVVGAVLWPRPIAPTLAVDLSRPGAIAIGAGLAWRW